MRKKSIFLGRFRENLFCAIWRKKTVPKWAARSCKNLLFMFDSCEDLKFISTALTLRTQCVAIRRNLKHTQEAPKVNISLGRCVIAELTGCLCNCNESER